jgi:hypothetical protein
MRTEIEIRTELDTQLESYRSNVNKWTRLQVEESNAIVKALQAELNDFYIKGAILHDDVKNWILGGLHGMWRANGQFEIGCTIRVERLGQIVPQGLCARGGTREEAISNWNERRFVQ